MSILEKMLRWVVIGGIFLLPIVPWVIATSMFFPFITGKNFAFRIIVEIITGAWLALALVDAKYRPRRSWILAAFSIFVIILAVADAQGVNPFKSFWSNYERMDGWVTLAHLLAYIVVAVSVMHSEGLWRRLFQFSLLNSAGLAIWGLLQIFGVTSIGQVTGVGLAARIDARFGNPIYLAVYMLFHVFIAALLWAQTAHEQPKRRRTWVAISYGSVMLLDTAVLFLTGTRGTMIGLLGGALLSAIILVIFARNSRFAWRFSIGLVVLICAMAVGVISIRNAPWIHNIVFLDRLASISLGDNTIGARFLNMGIAWEGVKERPILGWGQENYAIVFDKYYDPRMYGQEQWFDRVHNSIFDWLIAGGILGLIAYLSIFATAIAALWRRNTFTLPERAILSGLLAGYFFHNLFVFDNVTSYILFATVVAYIAYRAQQHTHIRPIITGALPRNVLPVVAGVAAVMVWGVAWFVNGNALAANRSLLMGLMPQQAGVMKNLDYFKQSIAYGTYGMQEAREQLAQAASQVAGAQQVPLDQKQQFFDTATQEMQKQMQASPLDARFPLFLGTVLDAYGDYKDAGVALQKAHELSPRKQSILIVQAQNAQAQSDNEAALKFYETAYELDHKDLEALYLYVAAAITFNKDAVADTILAPLIAAGEGADTRVLSALIARRSYSTALKILDAHIAKYPEDVQTYFTEAAVYYQMGNNQKAIDMLQKAITINPQMKSQAESLIQQIRTGTVGK